MPNMNSIQAKTKELATHHCGCHGNLVTIAARYVVDGYCPKELPSQIWTQYNLRQKNYKAKCILTQTHSSGSMTHWTHKSGQLEQQNIVAMK